MNNELQNILANVNEQVNNLQMNKEYENYF